MIQNLIQVIWIIFFLVLAAGVVICLIIRRFLKKTSRMANDETASFSNVRREDISSYICFDDIQDGVLILDNYTRFVSAIEVSGYDLYHATPEEQEAVMQRYTQLFDMMPDDEYLQIRYNPQSIDMDSYIQRYNLLYEEVSRTIYEKLETLDLIERQIKKLEKAGKLDSPDGSLYMDKSVALNKELVSLSSQKAELNEMVKYLRALSGEGSDLDMRATYCFTWRYNSSIGKNRYEDTLDRDQLVARAKEELRSMANSYISALSEANLYAKQITSTERMTDIFRRYFRPVSGSRFKVADILRGSAMDYVVDSEDSRDSVPSGQGDQQETVRLAEAHARVIDERKEEFS